MKYKVKKDFTTTNGGKYTVGMIFEYQNYVGLYVEWLTSEGYIEEVKEDRWKPDEGDTYYYLEGSGIPLDSDWYDNLTDLRKYEIGNVYLTEEEAEFEYERRKVETELKDLTNGFEPDWDDSSEDRFYLYYDHGVDQIKIDESVSWQINVPYFKSEEDIYNAIETIGEDRLKKYYFNVKE